ncbi:MAG: UvrD-helicase domain-containing protein [Deltaproteobacteria bacterium]|nr:UvrD-helicase domain-containing protein [Deltaproteobacteria bacterium]
MTSPVLQDDEARHRAATDLETTFLVEAGAGTGKTSVLVQRLLTIVRSGRGQLDRLAAITFTEKAATELRDRLYSEIEAALAQSLPEQERQLLREARRQFERAHIATVHAFCADLLRERPVEARVDPDFAVLDALETRLLQHEVWRDWLAREMDEGPAALKQALRADVTLTHLEALRDFLLEHRDSLSLLPAPVEERVAEFARESPRVVERLSEGAQSCVERTDRAFLQIVALRELFASVPDDAAWERLLLHPLPISAKAGAKTNWKPTTALEEVRQGLARLAEVHSNARAAWAHNLTLALAAWLRGYLAAYEEEKRARGGLDFVDLLLLARDLLKHDLSVRQYFHNRFRFLLVDEFQDTDPLQAEIIFFLAERVPRAVEWTEVTLQPGKLFLVGDPQQSIYRFRRADLQVYARVRELIVGQGETLVLATNFRTRAPALTWINDTFTREFATGGGGQPAYRPLQEARLENTGKEVVVLPVPGKEEKQDREERRQAEARAVAAFLVRTVGELGLELWGEQTIHYRDVAILCRTHQTLEVYEEALREAGIPYRVIGGRRVAHREEVEELRALLRAVDRPSDTTALVATLRSSMFGFSDEDLAAFVGEGGQLDYVVTAPPSASSLLGARFAAAFTFLHDLHVRRAHVSPAALLTDIYTKTHLLPLHSLQPHGAQRVANLLQMVETLRTFSQRSAATLTGLNRFLASQTLAMLENDAPLLEDHEPAVRLLTVHQAKGLEFPVVVLADASYRRQRSNQTGIVERIGGRLALKLGPRDLMCSTLGWREAETQEQEREAAEERRLWYVAATRVRDHLIVPVVLSGGAEAKPTEHWAVTEALSARLADRTPWKAEAPGSDGSTGVFIYRLPDAALQTEATSVSTSVLFSRVEPDAGALRDFREWERARAATLASGRQAPAMTTVTTLTASAPWERAALPDNAEPRREGQAAGLRFGRAVHAALRRATTHGIAPETAAAVSGVRETEEQAELARLVKNTLASPLMQRARQSESRFAEVPFSLHLSGRLLEGIIDFAFIENGAWILMDFKTDHVAPARANERAASYRAQVQLYALALERLTHRPIAELIVFFVRPQHAVTFSWGEEERRSAETLVCTLPETREATA